MIAGPLGLGICASLYILANIAYFSAVTKVRQLSSSSTRGLSGALRRLIRSPVMIG